MVELCDILEKIITPILMKLAWLVTADLRKLSPLRMPLSA
jgi:hypothetical protein